MSCLKQQGGWQTCCQGGEHAQGCTGDSEHVGQGEADEDGNGDDDAGDDGRLVAEGQAEDDVGGGSGAASISHVLQEKTYQ